MLIAAVLIELEIAQAESIKAKRRVVKSVIDRVSRRYRVSIAEVAEHDDRHLACIGCVKVGVHPQHLREQMEKILRFVESLGLAEVVGDDITIARLAELEEVDEDELRGAGRLVNVALDDESCEDELDDVTAELSRELAHVDDDADVHDDEDVDDDEIGDDRARDDAEDAPADAEMDDAEHDDVTAEQARELGVDTATASRATRRRGPEAETPGDGSEAEKKVRRGSGSR
jgi:uncharacterized protein